MLKKYVDAHPKSAFFEPRAEEHDLVNLERTIGRLLPPSYREFLSCYNGGFIVAEGNSDDPDWNFEIAKWNSIRILSVSAIQEAFSELQNQLLVTESSTSKLFIPCIVGPNEELLVFDHPKKQETEPKILDAFHECPPDEWETAFRNFHVFLKKYVKNHGDIETVFSG